MTKGRVPAPTHFLHSELKQNQNKPLPLTPRVWNPCRRVGRSDTGNAIMELNSTWLLSALAGVDLASADGRAGIASILHEIERRDPGAILRSAARVQGRQLLSAAGGTEHIRRDRAFE